MIKTTGSSTERFLIDLASVTRRIERAQEQITSGRRVNRASDAPDEISRLLQLRSELGAAQQIQTNLGRVQSESDAAEQALAYAVSLVERASVLGAQGATDVLAASDRQTLGREVASLLQQLTGVANTAIDGRYLFGGDTDQTAPYTLDLTLDAPFSAYLGTASTRQIQHPSGSRFTISTSADLIFDSADSASNVFQAVNDLRLALRDDDVAGVRDALGRLKSASDHLNRQLAFYGTVQNQVHDALEYGQTQQVGLLEQIAGVEDADMASAILELNESRFQHQAALSAESSRIRGSLFDYLR
jgi:flagellar hook-associated protein 3 FlgL